MGCCSADAFSVGPDGLARCPPHWLQNEAQKKSRDQSLYQCRRVISIPGPIDTRTRTGGDGASKAPRELGLDGGKGFGDDETVLQCGHCGGHVWSGVVHAGRERQRPMNGKRPNGFEPFPSPPLSHTLCGSYCAHFLSLSARSLTRLPACILHRRCNRRRDGQSKSLRKQPSDTSFT